MISAAGVDVGSTHTKAVILDEAAHRGALAHPDGRQRVRVRCPAPLTRPDQGEGGGQGAIGTPCPAGQWPPLPCEPPVRTLKICGLLGARHLDRAERALVHGPRDRVVNQEEAPGTSILISTMAAPPAGTSVVWTLARGAAPIAASVYTVSKISPITWKEEIRFGPPLPT